jgi:hypothetical protein
LKKGQLESFRRTASPPLKDHQKTASNPSIRDEPQAGKKQPGESDIPQDQLPHQPNQANIAKPPSFHPIRSSTETENETENETIRLTNAYPGALNTISSIHQRTWYLSLDRPNSGFAPQRHKSTGHKTWVRKWTVDGTREGFERFHVLGRKVERSVVTGRLAGEILADEGVEGFVPRRGWRRVVE